MESVQMTQSLREMQGVTAAQYSGAIGAGMTGLLGSGGSFNDIILQMLNNTVTSKDMDSEQSALMSEYANMLNFFIPAFLQNNEMISETDAKYILSGISEMAGGISEMAETTGIDAMSMMKQYESAVSKVFKNISNQYNETNSEITYSTESQAVDVNAFNNEEYSQILENAVDLNDHKYAFDAVSKNIAAISGNDDKKGIVVPNEVNMNDETVMFDGVEKNGIFMPEEVNQNEKAVTFDSVVKNETDVPKEVNREVNQNEKAVTFDSVVKNETAVPKEVNREVNQNEKAVTLDSVVKNETDVPKEVNREVNQNEKAVTLDSVVKKETDVPKKVNREVNQNEKAVTLNSVVKKETDVPKKVNREVNQNEKAVTFDSVVKNETAVPKEVNREVNQNEKAVTFDSVVKKETAVPKKVNREVNQNEKAVTLDSVVKKETDVPKEVNREVNQNEKAVTLDSVVKNETAVPKEVNREVNQNEKAVTFDSVVKNEAVVSNNVNKIDFAAKTDIKSVSAEQNIAEKINNQSFENMSEMHTQELSVRKAAEQSSYRTNEPFVTEGIENKKTVIEPMKSDISGENANHNQSKGEFNRSSGLDFLNKVNEFKESLASKENKTFEMPDIETLQRNADMFDIRSNMISAMSAEKTEIAEPPSKQLMDSIKENIHKGIDEFTVRLKPEGLGEIIVKLVTNEGGKMLMSMTASSVKTAELINRDIATLQSSLNQHNVEIVNRAQTEHIVPTNSVFEHYYGEGQEHNQNMQNWYNSSKNRYSYINQEVFSDEVPEEELKIASGLDIIV